MNDKILCPYCGGEMFMTCVEYAENPDEAGYAFRCEICGADSPACCGEEAAQEAARKRCQPECSAKMYGGESDAGESEAGI